MWQLGVVFKICEDGWALFWSNSRVLGGKLIFVDFKRRGCDLTEKISIHLMSLLKRSECSSIDVLSYEPSFYW